MKLATLTFDQAEKTVQSRDKRRYILLTNVPNGTPVTKAAVIMLTFDSHIRL